MRLVIVRLCIGPDPDRFEVRFLRQTSRLAKNTRLSLAQLP